MRFNASGGLDTSFGTSGIAMMPPPSASDTAADIEMQSDGKIVFVGNRHPDGDLEWADEY